jgi:serine/threonine protein kinase
LVAYGNPLDPRTNPHGERADLKLGRYEIVRELGKGAMGIVYLAKDPLIGRLVALKTIRLGVHSDDDETREFQQRFVREAQAAGILNHPSIVTVHDIGQDETGGMSFIAMEYVEGQNLKEVMSSGKALNFEQIADIVAQVADALDFAHAKGIVHRDVKPANIILVEGNRAKITDFGIAKIASGGANLTSTGQFLGTPNYMAPEQIKGAPVDGRTDIFSLGICLYECLTRRKPFGGDSLTSISYKIVHEPFQPLHEVNPQIPEGFEDVVANCLQKDPAKRYQRGKELAAALRAVIRGERPVRTDPVLADETVITRNSDRVPTVEIPFPDAPDAEELGTKASGAAPAVVPIRPVPTVRSAAAKAANPLRYPIPPPLFIVIVLVLVGGLAWTVTAIRRSAPQPRVVDTRAEAKSARERQLRLQANDLLRKGRLDEAYAKFQELSKLAPSSPAVTAILQKLSVVRQQDMISKQQFALAKEKYDQGLVLFNEKKYADSIPLFEESFHLNPSSDDTANYLKLAQQEQQKADEAKRARIAQTRTMPTTTRGTTTTTTTASTRTAGLDTSHSTSNAPAQLTTYFNGSNLTDGYIQVKVGSAVLVHENLWEEKESRIFHRKSKVGRVVSVTRELTPANTDVEIWVMIPAMQIQEHRTIRENFQPGSAHKLTVTFDPQSKKFDYQLN